MQAYGSCNTVLQTTSPQSHCPSHWLLLPLSSRKAPPLEFVIRRAGREDVGAMAAMDGGGATWTADSIYVSGWGGESLIPLCEPCLDVHVNLMLQYSPCVSDR